jgi:hypothetical protein
MVFAAAPHAVAIVIPDARQRKWSGIHFQAGLTSTWIPACARMTTPV